MKRRRGDDRGDARDDMEIAFASETLHTLANDFQLSCEKLGRVRAQRYLMRLQELRAARSFGDVADAFRPVQWSRTTGCRNYTSALDADHRMVCREVDAEPKGKTSSLPVRGAKVEILEIKRQHV